MSTASLAECPRVISSRIMRSWSISSTEYRRCLPWVREGTGNPYRRSHDLIVGTGMPSSDETAAIVMRVCEAARSCIGSMHQEYG